MVFILDKMQVALRLFMKVKSFYSVILILIVVLQSYGQSDQLLKSRTGVVSFVSEAPLELIKATSQKLDGILDLNTGEFGFQVDVNSFEGFNNPLQRLHFQENYMQTDEYPKAIFLGKIIETDLLKIHGTHSVRAKGTFDIHGIQQERIIRGDVTIEKGLLIVDVDFSVLLEDHGIRVPRIVHQKIAEEIIISLRIELR